MPTHPSESFVQPVMTSSKKRAALGSLSPKIRTLAPQAHTSLGNSTPNISQDPSWEARFQDAVRQALLTMGTPLATPGMDSHLTQPAPALTLSTTALKEAEAAHAAQGQRLRDAREMQKALEVERARKEAEAAKLAAEASRKLQAQLQAQLQQLAVEDATAAHAFAKQREKMVRESQAIAQRLQLLQNNPQTLPAGNPPAHQVDWTTFSPHLNHTSILPGRTATNKQGLRSL